MSTCTDLLRNMHSSFIHTNQKLETTQIPINRRKDKQKRIHRMDYYLLGDKKE